MGVFGPGIFADDDALDVRSEYKYALAEHRSNEKTTDALAAQYGATFADPANTTGFWLALAWTQWNYGRLDPRVLDVSLRIVDENLDIAKWEGSRDRAKRAAALRAFRAKIVSPQPKEKPIPKPPPVQLPGWEFGEVVAVHTAGRVALLHMIAYRRSQRYNAKAPVVSILNWTRADLPTAADLEPLTYINWRTIQIGNHLYSLAATPPDRFIRLGLKKPVLRAEADTAFRSKLEEETLDDMLRQTLEPYWLDPTLPPHHPGFDKPEAKRFKPPFFPGGSGKNPG